MATLARGWNQGFRLGSCVRRLRRIYHLRFTIGARGTAVGLGLLLGVILATGGLAAETNAPVKLVPARDGNTNKVAKISYKDFAVIGKNNIFNPNRTPPRPPSIRAEAPRRPKVDAFSLVGTMSYEKGQFAFFDGNHNGYKKALQVGGQIGDYTVTEIATNQVTLTVADKAIEVSVGKQLRREDGGDWQLLAMNGTFTAPAKVKQPQSVLAPGWQAGTDARESVKNKLASKESLMEAVAAGDFSGLSEKQLRKLDKYDEPKMDKDFKEPKDFKPSKNDFDGRGMKKSERRMMMRNP